LDRLGNEVEHSFTDPEIYYRPWTRYAMVDKDPNDSSKSKERKCVAAGINELKPELKEYTLPFNEENFDMLFKQRTSQSPNSVSLAISDEGSSEKPRQITNPEHFAKRQFDEMWQEMITPKFKLDRSYRDNLEGCHIG
jgi:hypothetical protein